MNPRWVSRTVPLTLPWPLVNPYPQGAFTMSAFARPAAP